MDTNKAAYWIAVGVLALGVRSEYQQGHFLALHRVADRTGATMCRISTHAEQTLAFARLFSTGKVFVADRLLASTERAEMARDEAESIREQAQDEAERIRESVREQGDEIRVRADVMRAQAEVQRVRVERIRFETRQQFRLADTTRRRVAVLCPKAGMRIAVNADGDTDVSTEVEDSNTF